MTSSVTRETLEAVLGRFGVDVAAASAFEALLGALAAEPDPPTTVADPAAALDVHVADSLSGLAVEQLREATTIADLGSGAGFPGLALAAALPAARVDLVEATARKCEVIARLSAAAGLTRARVIASRAEEWAAGEGAGVYEAVTARAVAPLAVLCEYAAPLLQQGGALIAWKGRRDEVEEAAGAAAAAALGLSAARTITVSPFPAARFRHLHVYVKEGPTPLRFPRRAGIAVKRPLA